MYMQQRNDIYTCKVSRLVQFVARSYTIDILYVNYTTIRSTDQIFRDDWVKRQLTGRNVTQNGELICFLLIT